MKQNKTKQPNWIEEITPPNTYRSLFKWGDPGGFKHPNAGWWH